MLELLYLLNRSAYTVSLLSYCSQRRGRGGYRGHMLLSQNNTRMPTSRKTQVPDEERKLNFKLWGPPVLNDTTENQHQIISSDTMKLTRDSATSPPYSFPPTHDNQSLPSFQRYVGLPGRVQSSLHGLDQQVEGVASTSGAGTHGGPMEFQRSVLETGDDTSSVRTSSTAQSSPDLADLTGIARSFQPQTELLNPCAMINEFILNTHPHVNVAITHSGEWSSALSQGDDSDDLLRVLSDYKVIVHDGVAMLEAR
ncbi:hypothetical protein EV421DRAFT_580185 [Armillaria borealis]|uniref:Uncharacterized protein n=1 Tax=Armillaria borealis TaxID=47425 RepID=A0AA39JHP7_9AGAR|nr:hypothetical protein EV421DRAFT_580185 [Armillaria borealis]